MTQAKQRVAMIPVQSIEQIPAGMTEVQARQFWDSHEITDELLESTPPLPPGELPPTRPRTRPLSLRFDEDALRRVRALARKKHKGYQTLLKEFVVERLYEEEKREGLVG